MFDIAWAGLSTLVSLQGAATVAGNAPAGGLLAPGGRVPSELPVKALVGSPAHHESGLGSNAVEGTDQQRLPLDDRLPCLCSGFPAAARTVTILSCVREGCQPERWPCSRPSVPS